MKTVVIIVIKNEKCNDRKELKLIASSKQVVLNNARQIRCASRSDFGPSPTPNVTNPTGFVCVGAKFRSSPHPKNPCLGTSVRSVSSDAND